jgi:hypothetical protein
MNDNELFIDSVRIYEGVNETMLAQNAAEIVEAETISESPVIQDYIDGQLTGNTAAKKLFAAALTIANNKGYISLPEKYSNPQTIAVVADKTLETIKLAHDVATGKFRADKAVDYLIDKGAAIAKTAVDKWIDKGAPIVADRVTDMLVSVYPPCEVARPYVHKVTQFVAQKVKPLVHKGIDKIAEVAKPIVKKAVEKVQKVATTVWEGAKKVGGKILSLFGF